MLIDKALKGIKQYKDFLLEHKWLLTVQCMVWMKDLINAVGNYLTYCLRWLVADYLNLYQPTTTLISGLT
jgi:hypothetical protein